MAKAKKAPQKRTQKRAQDTANDPLIWTITTGENGMVNQSVGLAEASGFRHAQQQVKLRKIFYLLPGHIAAKIGRLHVFRDKSGNLYPDLMSGNFPNIIIGCGRRSIAACLAIKTYLWRKHRHKVFLVYIHHPRIPLRYFDMIVPSFHDAIEGKYVYPTGPSLHRINEKLLAQAKREFSFKTVSRPLLSVMIGGNNRSYQMTDTVAEFAGGALGKISQKFGITLSFSRRTPINAKAILLNHLKRLDNIFIWNHKGKNPYFAMLAHADALLVSAESVSMISEAIFTGKPVYLLQLPGHSKRFVAFHNWLYQNDYARPFAGKIDLDWGKSIDDTKRIAAILKAQYREFISGTREL